MVLVFDFATVEEVKNANSLNLKSISEWQGDISRYVFFEVHKVIEEYIKHFEKKVKDAEAQYIFVKDLQ
ncbi:MAG: hypothetical protein PHX04_06485 [Bacilli bacterium]|nr:hypothetical protein [Bacilli bacterium]